MNAPSAFRDRLYDPLPPFADHIITTLRLAASLAALYCAVRIWLP